LNVDRAADILEYGLCKLGIRRFASWEDALSSEPVRLYAGKLRRGLPQFRTHWGITPFYASTRNIHHDVTLSYPIPDNSVEVYQSEDVFEHIEEHKILPIINEIYRILKPGGVFRLSLPDYNFDLNRARTQRGPDGEFLFDPGGGGRLENGKVVDGGHVWFPTISSVRALFERSRFADGGECRFLQYNAEQGEPVMERIDYSIGYIQRTPDHDPRVADNPRPLSIVVDAIKHAA